MVVDRVVDGMEELTEVFGAAHSSTSDRRESSSSVDVGTAAAPGRVACQACGSCSAGSCFVTSCSAAVLAGLAPAGPPLGGGGLPPACGSAARAGLAPRCGGRLAPRHRGTMGRPLFVIGREHDGRSGTDVAALRPDRPVARRSGAGPRAYAHRRSASPPRRTGLTRTIQRRRDGGATVAVVLRAAPGPRWWPT